MSLAQLIYISRSRKPMDRDAVQAIAAHSETKNAPRDISGALLSVGPYFMQLLEGELADIVALYEHIRDDVRHTEVKCLLCKNVNKRLFPQWGMRMLEPDATGRLDLDRLHRLIEEFRVHRTTGAFAVEARVLLDDFKRQLLDAA